MKPAIDPEICHHILGLQVGERCFVAVMGPPASGKSAYADALCAELNAKGGQAVVLQMDGYHLDNAILDACGDRARKGAPHTFDVAGLQRDLGRLRDGQGTVYVPIFDRALDLSRAAARAISPACRIILVEGNYLLLDQEPWRSLHGSFDLSIALDVPEPVLAARLHKRWRDLGLSERDVAAKVLENDLPNARLIREHSIPATLVVQNWHPDNAGDGARGE